MKLPVTYSKKLASTLEGTIVLIKYGGNAMVNDDVKRNVISDIACLKKLGITPVIVHGGGRAIKKLLDEVGVQSEFVGGHRKTDAEAMHYVEMALSGNVNSELVKLISSEGLKAVGLSGKDGRMVTATKRIQQVARNGENRPVDLGFVGDVDSIDTNIVHTLVKAGYIPVISPVAMDKDFNDFNINADMFAGHMAGALKASHYVALTDVDGLLADKDDPSTLVRSLTLEQAEAEMGGMIQGGMIPKVESCLIALRHGVQSAHIINGRTQHSILSELLTKERAGTLINKD